MEAYTLKLDPLTGEEYYEVHVRGEQVLAHPLLNKGSAFSEEERQTLGLAGLLRPAINNIALQQVRSLENYRDKRTDMGRYIYLQSLQDRNETLYFRLLVDNLREMLPIVYTPTVGEACLKMSHIMRRYRGVYLSPDNIRRIDQIFENVASPDLALIVVTDGERILGLGDLGSDGMGIPVGKVNLYVAAGGLHPTCCLPVMLDVGTNNQRLLEDPMYLGWRHPRLSGAEYDEFLERFVLGVRRSYPNALLQWEDFGKQHAFKLLERYRDRILSFNDDIQGTGSTALAALYTAMRIKGRKFSDERFVLVGMGQAGVGIGRHIKSALMQEGLSEADARRRIFAVDVPGLLTDDTPGLEEPQKAFAQPTGVAAQWHLETAGTVGLHDVVRNAEATVLIGVTGRAGLFDREVLAALGRNSERPVVMALSNPTSKSECTPQDVAKATAGRGLFATGSPFGSIEHDGRTIKTSQCNNLYVFPGMGLGVLVSKALKVTDRMFLAASGAIASMVTPAQRDQGLLLPEMEDVREVAAQVACAVAREARDAGLGRLLDDADIERVVRKAQWDPHYYPYRPGRADGRS